MKTYKCLLVGAGSMGQEWAKNLSGCMQIELAGWMDIAAGAAASAIEKHKLAATLAFDDLSKALAEIKPDFVVDVTVPQAHHEVTLAALAARIPVLGEKPMADSMAHARDMVAASEKAGRLYMVSQSRRYNGVLLAYKELIASLGPLAVLNSDFYLGPHFGGFRDEMASVLLLDMAIHTFDNARNLSSADPVSVYCEQFNPPWSWYEGEACATAMFEMTGGLRYTYRGSWCAQGLNTSWEAEWRAVGASGSATWDGHDKLAGALVAGDEGFIRPTREISPTVDKSIASSIAGSLREFLEALETGRTPQGECHDNIKSLAMVFAAVESAAAGRRVKVAF